ncbi:MAG: hypothetical protein JWM37_648 [Candidatus Saccharibacteria bacterium]|nr:hypothetical protein [Candidatus Saccharibacteria bacterium]
MSERQYEDRLYEELRHEVLFCGPAFEELLATAVETCLSSSESFQTHLKTIETRQVDDPEERQLLAQLGLWGVRAAVEVSDTATFHYWSEEESFCRPDHPVIFPERYSAPRDQAIVNKIEAFGVALMEEAFACLGEDAAEQAAALAASTNFDESKAALDWLAKRIKAIQNVASGRPAETESDTDDDEEEEAEAQNNEHFYHPVRLSPKLLGKYPDSQLDPTCLGVSLLSSAFFEKAGLRHLHAGVTVSDAQHARIDYMESFDTMLRQAEKYDVEFPDIIRRELLRMKYQNQVIVTENRGFHAVNLVRLPHGGHWAQHDVNYNRLIIFSNDDDTLDQYYERIEKFHAIQAGTEHVLALQVDDGVNFDTLLEEGLLQGLLPEREELDEALATGQVPAECSAIAECYVLPLLWREDSEALASLTDDAYDEGVYFSERLSRDALMEMAVEAVNRYVFWDTDVSGALQKCQTDPAYRQRRVEDLRAVPFYLANILAGEYADDIITGHVNQPHRGMEIGHPAYRLGAAVLSDFSVYLQPLPQSFWATYWPSRVVATEHYQADRDLDTRKFGLRLGATMMLHNLNYVHADGIIMKFLERSTTSLMEEDNHGNGRPEEVVTAAGAGRR